MNTEKNSAQVDELNKELALAFERAELYLHLYDTRQLTLEQLRFRLVKLAKSTSHTPDVYEDACTIIHELLDTYHSDPVRYEGVVSSPRKHSDSIALLFAPEDLFQRTPRNVDINSIRQIIQSEVVLRG